MVPSSDTRNANNNATNPPTTTKDTENIAGPGISEPSSRKLHRLSLCWYFTPVIDN